jgi:hypothetical protein
MTVKTAISLPDKVFAELETAAAEQGLSRSGLILAALEKYSSIWRPNASAGVGRIPRDFELDEDERGSGMEP